MIHSPSLVHQEEEEMLTLLPEIWDAIRITWRQLTFYSQWQCILNALKRHNRHVNNWASRAFTLTTDDIRDGVVFMHEIRLWWFHHNERIAMITSDETWYMLGGGDRRLFPNERYSFFIRYSSMEADKEYDSYIDKILRKAGGMLNDIDIDDDTPPMVD